MPENKVHVGIGEYAILKDSGVLESIGLGSCIGVCLWDGIQRVGGLAHVMLPNSEGRQQGNPYRFADKAVDALVADMLTQGAQKMSIKAKIFGGASLFEGMQIQIGEQNSQAVRAKLSEHKIKIVAEEVGGTHGRSVWFDVKTGSVVVGKIYGETREY